jgi:hypothetical protein
MEKKKACFKKNNPNYNNSTVVKYRTLVACTIIVYKGGEETSCVRRRLLSKSDCPFRVTHQHFIVERKEGETG